MWKNKRMRQKYLHEDGDGREKWNMIRGVWYISAQHQHHPQPQFGCISERQTSKCYINICKSKGFSSINAFSSLQGAITPKLFRRTSLPNRKATIPYL
jgi:hypothetical protein